MVRFAYRQPLALYQIWHDCIAPWCSTVTIYLIFKCTGNGPDSVTYIADKKGGRYDHRMDHLACFVPGMLALGVVHKPDAPTAARDMQTARELMDTCIKM